MLRRLRGIVLVLLFAVTCFAQSPQAVEQRVDSLLKQMTLEEKIDLIGGVDSFYIRAIPRLKVPMLKMADGPVGVRNYGPATTFGGIGLAATWDPELIQHMGKVIGMDARARGVHFLLGPGVNIYRASMNGRNFEYYGEDPFLAARTAVAYINGVQSQRVIATIKHFMGNNQEFDRHNTNSIIDERTMREIYLPVFEAAVKEAHVGSIMDAYGLTNGAHMTQNGYLNTDVVKKEWGFDGIIMSDWDATYDAVAAANGGLDLEMPSGRFMNRQNLIPAVRDGKVSEATIDDKVRRILRKAIQFGFFDSEQLDASIPMYSYEGRQVALEAARSAMVLLKNDGGLLPLDKNKTKSIAVIGPDAYPAQPVGGGSASVRPFAAVSFMEGLANYLGASAKVYYHAGLPTLQQMVERTEFTTAASNGQPGLQAEYFSNPDFSGTPETRIERRSMVGGAARHAPSANASIRWTGYYTPQTAGEYQLFVAAGGEGSGGHRLYLDDKLVVDNWDRGTAYVNYANTAMQPGTAHKVRLECHHCGNGRLMLGIVPPDGFVSAEALKLAARVDAVVLAAGFDQGSESEGGDRTFNLPPGQDALIRQIMAANKNTVVVITAGGATDMTRWIDSVPAVMQSWYAGQEGGTALAQLLFGDYSPSGRLPVTFERRWEDNATYNSYYPQKEKTVTYSEGVFVGYRHFDRAATKPLFPFGYGLSYTTFAYKNLTVTPATLSGDGPITVSFDVTNTGQREGAEVAQVYVGDKHASVPRPVKELKGFSKVNLKPGETKHITVTLDRRALSYYDVKNHRWTADPGDFEILVGRSAAQVELAGKVKLAQ